jgi:hypothetical protein
MPTPKNLAAMLEDLLKAQKVRGARLPPVRGGARWCACACWRVHEALAEWRGARRQTQDNERLCQILDMFLASSAITMEFVVNSGGKVVKALRGSQDEAVRKRALELTAQWKALVAGKLAAKVVVKEGDKDSKDEAGETWIARGPRTRKAHSARRALDAPVSSAAPPRSTSVEKDHMRTGRGCRAAAKAGGKSASISTAKTQTQPQTQTEPHTRFPVKKRACSGVGVVPLPSRREKMVLHLSLFVLLHLTPSSINCYSPPPPCGVPHPFSTAGAAGRGGAASPRPAAAGASASKSTPPGQLARPREGVGLKGGKVSLSLSISLSPPPPHPHVSLAPLIHTYILYVHMCYVLIRPPIPYITSSRC